MKKYYSAVIFCLLFLALNGCARLTEPFKILWGSSMKALEEARPNASVSTFQCREEECFRQVLSIAKENHLTVFTSDPKKPLIVLMGFTGSINTTEVGVFFSEIEPNKTKVEIVSLSPTAQEIATKLLTGQLKKTFTELHGNP